MVHELFVLALVDFLLLVAGVVSLSCCRLSILPSSFVLRPSVSAGFIKEGLELNSHRKGSGFGLTNKPKVTRVVLIGQCKSRSRRRQIH